jgi:hypothetical protein
MLAVEAGRQPGNCLGCSHRGLDRNGFYLSAQHAEGRFDEPRNSRLGKYRPVYHIDMRRTEAPDSATRSVASHLHRGIDRLK